MSREKHFKIQKKSMQRISDNVSCSPTTNKITSYAFKQLTSENFIVQKYGITIPVQKCH